MHRTQEFCRCGPRLPNNRPLRNTIDKEELMSHLPKSGDGRGSSGRGIFGRRAEFGEGVAEVIFFSAAEDGERARV